MKNDNLIKFSKKEVEGKGKISDEEFIGELKDKSGKEIVDHATKSWNATQRNLYETIRSLRALECTGKFREVGFKKFEDCPMKIMGHPISTYRTFLIVARKCHRELIERVGFGPLAYVIRKKLPASSEGLIFEKIEKSTETSDEEPSFRELKEIARKLAPPTDSGEDSPSRIKYLQSEIKRLRSENMELKKKRRDLEEEVEKLKFILQEERRYREDLQRGKRVM